MIRLCTFAIPFTIMGWMGILIYFRHFPVQFSPMGALIYFDIHALIMLLFVGFLMCCAVFFDTQSRDDAMSLKFLFFEYKINKNNPMAADIESRGYFLRGLKRTLFIKFPYLKGLFPNKYSYDHISPASDFSKLRKPNRRRTPQQETVWQLTHDSEVLQRWRYRDPRFMEIFEQLQSNPQESSSKRQIFLLVMFLLIMVPSEEGLFLAPPALLGLNGLTIPLFALLFGFAHFHQYSAINCFRIVCAAMLQLLFILPRYGLLSCIAGHVLWDFIFLIPMFWGLYRENRARYKLDS